MKNRRKRFEAMHGMVTQSRWLCAIALVAAIGFGVAGCEQPTDPVTAHVHQWGEWSVTPATCIAAGEKTRTCVLDATHKDTQPIAALGHDYQWKLTTYPTEIVNGDFTDIVETGICKHDSTHTETRNIKYQSLYYGRWKSSLSERTITLSAERFRTSYYLNTYRDFEMTSLTWTGTTNNESDSTNYPVGYTITGTVTSKATDNYTHTIGQSYTVYVFLNKDDPTNLVYNVSLDNKNKYILQ
jgi:hypothetical protein